jgi:hypothetical protein
VPSIEKLQSPDANVNDDPHPCAAMRASLQDYSSDCLPFGFVLDRYLSRVDVYVDMNRIGPAADLALLDEDLILARGEVHIDLVDFEAPGTAKCLPHGTPPLKVGTPTM